MPYCVGSCLSFICCSASRSADRDSADSPAQWLCPLPVGLEALPELVPFRRCAGAAPGAPRLNPALAHRARPDRDQPALWAIPGRGWICIYSTPGDRRDGSLACSSTGAAVTQGLDIYLFGAGSPHTFGLVPDGVDAVRVRNNPDRVAGCRKRLLGSRQGPAALDPPSLPRRGQASPCPVPARWECLPWLRRGLSTNLRWCAGPRRSPAKLRRSSRVPKPAQQQADAILNSGSIDPSGRFVAFFSAWLGSRPAGVYLRDLRRNRNRFLGPAGRAYLSAGDGGLLLYSRGGDSFARDLSTGAGPKVPRASGWFGDPAVSADTRFIALASAGGPPRGPGAEPGEGLPYQQIYACKSARRRCELVSRASGAQGAIGDGESKQPAISASGRYVAFSSEASDLSAGAVRSSQVYLRDRATARTTLVSRWPGAPRRSDATCPSLGQWPLPGLRTPLLGPPSRHRRPRPAQRPHLATAHFLSAADRDRPALQAGPLAGRPLPGLSRRQLARGLPDEALCGACALARFASSRRLAVKAGRPLSRGGRFLVFDTCFLSVPGRESEEPVSEGRGGLSLPQPVCGSRAISAAYGHRKAQRRSDRANPIPVRAVYTRMFRRPRAILEKVPVSRCGCHETRPQGSTQR